MEDRGISPARNFRRLESKLKGMFIRKQHSADDMIQAALAKSQSQQVHMVRNGSLIRPHETLAPLREDPDGTADYENGSNGGESTKRQGSFRSWMMEQIEKTALPLLGYKHSDVRLLLGVLGAPLAPMAAPTGEYRAEPASGGPIEFISAQYILRQYLAACGGEELLSSVYNSYVAGKIRMTLSEFHTMDKVVRTKNPFRPAESGCFVLWRMKPDMWNVELVLAGSSKVNAGCNGDIVWRHNPWMGPHAAKGPVRPLRRALQGLDPLTTASIFSGAVHKGEKQVCGEDCFVLKLEADSHTLRARSDGPAEIMRHDMFGYFSQRTGLLVGIADTHMTRIQASAGENVHWETSIESTLEDYRKVDGVAVAHSGHSRVTLFRFGENFMEYTRTKMEEEWSIEEVAFNVRGVSRDCFIPPANVAKSTHKNRKSVQSHA